MTDKLTLGKNGVDGQLIIRGADNAATRLEMEHDRVSLGRATLTNDYLTLKDGDLKFGDVTVSNGKATVGGERGLVVEQAGRSVSLGKTRIRLDADTPVVRLKGDHAQITLEQLEHKRDVVLSRLGLSIGRTDMPQQGRLYATKKRLELQGKNDTVPIPKNFSVFLEADHAETWPDKDGIEAPTDVNLLKELKVLKETVRLLQERVKELESS